MPQKLQLEDALDETPQTRALIDNFEKDAAMLKKFTKAIANSCQKLISAQNSMISASQELAYYLRLYCQTKSGVELTPDYDEETSKSKTCLNQFANSVDEITTCYQVFVSQLTDTMLYPLNKLLDHEFDELSSLSEMYHISAQEEDAVMQKFLRTPLRKDNETHRQQVNEEVGLFRKKYHHTAMNYFAGMNALQYKKNYILIEPMMRLMHGYKLFFKMGSETMNQSIEDFLNRTSTEVYQYKTSLLEEISRTAQLVDLLTQDESIYNPERTQPKASDGGDEATATNLITSLQKSGFLNQKSKIPFLSIWDRSFYFLHKGSLMYQQRNDSASYPLLELKSDLAVSPCDIDERRFSFQISSLFPKRTYYFQANNERDRDEWIQTLQTAIKDDNRAKLINYMTTNKPNLSIRDTKLQEQQRKSSTSSTTSATTAKGATPGGGYLAPNIRFDLPEISKESLLSNKMVKPQQGTDYKVRFLGSMAVKADKGNEYIHDTIRQVMAARANQNVFKMNEYNLIVNSESLSLFAIPSKNNTRGQSPFVDATANPLDDLIKARFGLSDIAFWAAHKENDRLFGFIVKESHQTLRFTCHVFESDCKASVICDSITRATQLAFQLLVDENKSEHLKRIKQAEKDILLANIMNMPDMEEDEEAEYHRDILSGRYVEGEEEESETGTEMLNHAAQVALNTPNPNFVVLDEETLKNLRVNVDMSNGNGGGGERSTTPTNEASNGGKTEEGGGKEEATSSDGKDKKVESDA